MQDIEFNGEITEPQMVVNSIISADSTIKIHLSKSRFFLDDDEEFEMIGNATISIFENNVLVDNFTSLNSTNGFFTSNFKPSANKNYSVEIESPDFDKKASGTTFVPEPVKIISIDTFHTSNDWGEVQINFALKFKDPENTDNFYKIEAIKESHGEIEGEYYSYIEPMYIESNDPLLNPDSQSSFFGDNSSGQTIFNDKLIDGIEYTVRFTAQSYNMFWEKQEASETIYVRLYSYSTDSYHFYLSQMQQNQTDGNPFIVQPVTIYDNIENGIGIWGGQSIDEKII